MTNAEQPAAQQPTDRPQRSAGRPRDRRAHRAILEATRDIAQQSGYGGVTIEGVARKAGVAKTTIYRWWRGKAALVYEACFVEEEQSLALVDTGSLARDVTELVEREVARQTAPLARRVLPGLIAEQAEGGSSAGFIERLLEPERALVSAVLDRARGRGELGGDATEEVLFDQLSGAIFHRTFVLGRSPDAGFQAGLTQQLLHGLGS